MKQGRPVENFSSRHRAEEHRVIAGFVGAPKRADDVRHRTLEQRESTTLTAELGFGKRVTAAPRKDPGNSFLVGCEDVESEPLTRFDCGVECGVSIDAELLKWWIEGNSRDRTRGHSRALATRVKGGGHRYPGCKTAQERLEILRLGWLDHRVPVFRRPCSDIRVT